MSEKTLRAKLRVALADYMVSEGCDCCENHDAHKAHAEVLAKLLNIPAYSDKSGYDFYKYKSGRKIDGGGV